MATFTLLAATTSADQSTAIRIEEQNLPAHFVCSPALAATETADLQYSADGGTTWIDYYIDGTQQQITDTNTGLVVVGPGFYRINKGATATATAVHLAYEGNV